MKSLVTDDPLSLPLRSHHNPLSTPHHPPAPLQPHNPAPNRSLILGLYDYIARRYDPWLGRFIQPDTGDRAGRLPKLSDPQSLNRYSSVLNNPIKYRDPTGHWEIEGPGYETCGGIGCLYPAGHPLAGYTLGTTQADVASGQVQMMRAVGAGVDFIPGIGDAKGVIEVFTGQDIISGESLGHWRWLGLIGMSELRHLRHLRHADEAVDFASNLSRTRRIFTHVVEFQDFKVYQRSDIDWNRVDVRGRTNLERAQSGSAPIGSDGRPIVLHHIGQKSEGPLAEVMWTTHQKGYSTLHSNTGQYPSQIDRGAFRSWRESYWQARALQVSQ